MKVIIPAAGYATRLHPLTLDKPKHLLEVQGKTIIDHILAKIEEIEHVDEIFVVSNQKYNKNFQDWAKSLSTRTKVHVLNDGTTSNEDRLGQIGDIKFAMDKGEIDEDLMIIAGDNLFNFSLSHVYNKLMERRVNLNALYDIKSKDDASKLGVATIDGKGKIIEFQEKPEEPNSTLISMGIYLFPKENLHMISKYLDDGNNPDKMGYFMEWLLKNDELHSHVHEEEWFDIGYHSALERARKNYKG